MEQGIWTIKWMLQPVRNCKKGCICMRVAPAIQRDKQWEKYFYENTTNYAKVVYAKIF